MICNISILFKLNASKRKESYCWFVINHLRFITQRYGGHVGGKHVRNKMAANDILLLTVFQHGRAMHEFKC